MQQQSLFNDNAPGVETAPPRYIWPKPPVTVIPFQLVLFDEFFEQGVLFGNEPDMLLDQNSIQPPAKETVKCDPYSVSPDGHFIGFDGFEVPKDFTEFYERFPRYIKQFVMGHLRNKNDWEREECENDLVVFLLTLPTQSKYRKPGYNGHANGCTDRIQVFDPARSFGCSAPRWKSWLNRCLTNQLCHQADKSSRSPLQRYSTVTLTNESPGTKADGVKVNDEFLLREAKLWVGPLGESVATLNKGVFVAEFIGFVNKHNPELLPVVEILKVVENRAEAQKTLGMSKQRFKRAFARIQILVDAFKANQIPPRQRIVCGLSEIADPTLSA